jgi:hypothetical protein
VALSDRSGNSRQFPRYAVELEASIDLEGETLEAVTRDIGRGGICLVGPRAVASGRRLNLSLKLVLGTTAFSEGLELDARVIWCTPISAHHQIGAVFTEMTAAKLGQLDMLLRFLQQEILLEGSEPADEDEKFDTGDIDD